MAVFTNQATLSYNGVVTNSNVVTGEILQVLSIEKTALSPTYGIGDIITYSVSITNSGGLNYTDISVTDDLGAYPFDGGTLVPLTFTGDYLFYVNGVLRAAPDVTAGPPLVFSSISVPAGSTAMLIYSVAVNSFAPPEVGGTIINTVSIGAAGLTSPVTDDETITAAAEPILSICKSVSPPSVVENGELTYTFTIQNTGNTPADAVANVVVSDVFNPPLSDIVVTLDGEILSSPADYTYDEVSGQFSTTAGVITVPAATYSQDSVSGMWTVTPSSVILTVKGTI